MGIIYTEVRISNFAQPDLEEITVTALVDTGALDLVIPEHLAIQLRLNDLRPREVHLADGSRKLVRYAGPIKVEAMGRDCVTAAVVMGDQVLLGAIPMQAMDVVVHPRTEQVVPNPRARTCLRSLQSSCTARQADGESKSVHGAIVRITPSPHVAAIYAS